MKKHVLNIDFKEDQGVILNWNYSDLSRKTKYYRHVLVLATGDTAKAEEFSKVIVANKFFVPNLLPPNREKAKF